MWYDEHLVSAWENDIGTFDTDEIEWPNLVVAVDWYRVLLTVAVAYAWEYTS